MLRIPHSLVYTLALTGLFLCTSFTPASEAAVKSPSYYLNATADYNAKQPIYVTGHREPDADTVCSSIACAELLKAMNYQAEAVLPGKLNAETSYALKKFQVPVPKLMQSAAGKQFVLVDHSLYRQALDGMQKADVLAVMDHHALGDIKNPNPITYLIQPLGATCTIVYNEFQRQKLKITQPIAGLLLTGICSDTIGLKSPTTTDFDRQAVTKLAKLSKVKDYRAYTKELLDAGNIYDSLSAAELCHYDYKQYAAGSKTIGIAQVQSANAEQLDRLEARTTSYMEQSFQGLGVDMYFMMLTNLDSFSTKLLCFGKDSLTTAQKAFTTQADTIILLNTVSRKKQIAPQLERALADK